MTESEDTARRCKACGDPITSGKQCEFCADFQS